MAFLQLEDWPDMQTELAPQFIGTADGTMAQIPVEIRSSDMDWVGIRATKEIPEGKVVIRGASALEAIFAKD